MYVLIYGFLEVCYFMDGNFGGDFIFLKKIVDEHKNFGKQVLMLSKTELIKTYKGSALGPVWAIVKPAFTLFVYWFAFTIGLRNSGFSGAVVDGKLYEMSRFTFLLVGFIPWFFIQESILQGSKSIRSHRQYVTKVNFPVSTIMTFTSLSRLYIHLALSVIMYAIVCLTTSYGPSWYNLQYFLYLPIMFLFFLFLSWSTAPMCAISPDMTNAISSFMSGVFWLSGIIYNSYELDEPLRQIMLFNPINFFVNGYRNTFLYHRAFYENEVELIIFLIEFAVVFVLGVYNYNRLRKRLPDVL